MRATKTQGSVAFAVLIGAATAFAQGDYTIRPNSPIMGGGYTVYGANNMTPIQTIRPNSPIMGGGYTVYGANNMTPIQTIRPISPIMGGGWSVSGSQFRGADNKDLLFDAPEFASRLPEDEWIGAVEMRDASAMTRFAWGLKAIEAILGKQDKKTTSIAMFKAAAQIAVEQKNVNALAEVIALCPECKSFEADMKAASASRGTGSAIALPQIIYPQFGALDPANPDAFKKQVDELTKELQPWQTPALTPDLVRYTFRGMSTPDAENVALLANRGRQTCNASMLAQAAVAIAGQEPGVKISCLDPKRMLDEAAGMALVMEDKKSLSLIAGISENNILGLKDEDRAKNLLENIKAMSSSRGGAKDDSGFPLRLIKLDYHEGQQFDLDGAVKTNPLMGVKGN